MCVPPFSLILLGFLRFIRPAIVSFLLLRLPENRQLVMKMCALVPAEHKRAHIFINVIQSCSLANVILHSTEYLNLRR
jgi:hypothetical protein